MLLQSKFYKNFSKTRYLNHFLLFICSFAYLTLADRNALYQPDGQFLPHVRLAKDLVDERRYDNRVRPVVDHRVPTRVSFSMSLYQILAINEKMQSVDLNVWVIQKWKDEFLGWNPHKYNEINTTILPHEKVWLPDTYLYNSVVMNREETERYINVVVTTDYWERQRGAQIKFMYPALYRVSCRIEILYFPYDQQKCTLIISSWTSDKGSIDYIPEFDFVNLDNFIPNEEWVIVSFNIRRVEEKFVCCPEPWVLLEAELIVQRKPLYYIVNLVIPTSVITLVAVTGFFTPASTTNERREKLSLGIDSLLAMSILMMMVSEQMPTTSDYVPLFGIFYLSIIFIIFMGTLFTAFILNIHLQKSHNKPIPPLISYIFFHKIAPFLGIRPSTTLLELWQETGVRIRGLNAKNKPRRRDLRKRVGVVNSTIKQPASTNITPLLQLTPSTMKADKFFAEGLTVANGQKGQNASLSANNMHMRATSKHSDSSIGFKRLSPLNFLDEAQSQKSLGSFKEAHEDLISEYDNQTTRPRYKRMSTARARNNWKRIAQKALAKYREESMQKNRFVASPGQNFGGFAYPITYQDIPFADISPSRSALSSPRCPLPPPPHPLNLRSPQLTVGHAHVRPSPQPIDAGKMPLSQKAARMYPMMAVKHRFSTTIPSALQLFCAPAAPTGDPVAHAAAMLDMKLRRRFAHEWEFLATVLDRVLLIIFSGLVVLVTGSLMLFGEYMHILYAFQALENEAAQTNYSQQAGIFSPA